MRLPCNLDVRPEVADHGQALIEERTADMLTALRRRRLPCSMKLQGLRETFSQTFAWDRGSTKLVLSLVEPCSRAA
jgi:hypothetical protein